MNHKPQHISGYDSGTTAALHRLCLLLATRLNDLMPDVRIVGGLVPSLITDTSVRDGGHPHVGTMDLDLGLQISVLDGSRYQEISRRLRGAGFTNHTAESSHKTRQSWIHENGLTVDFLIPPANEDSKPGGLQDLEHDFAAVITPGLELAFLDYETIELDDNLPTGDQVTRSIWVCGPGAFLVLKALAFRNRAEPKDAYDLHYMLTQWTGGVEDIVQRVCNLARNPLVETAVEYLKEDFSSIDSIGPGSIDRFLAGETFRNDELRADSSGIVLEFCRQIQDNVRSS